MRTPLISKTKKHNSELKSAYQAEYTKCGSKLNFPDSLIKKNALIAHKVLDILLTATNHLVSLIGYMCIYKRFFIYYDKCNKNSYAISVES